MGKGKPFLPLEKRTENALLSFSSLSQLRDFGIAWLTEPRHRSNRRRKRATGGHKSLKVRKTLFSLSFLRWEKYLFDAENVREGKRIVPLRRRWRERGEQWRGLRFHNCSLDRNWSRNSFFFLPVGISGAILRLRFKRAENHKIFRIHPIKDLAS